MSIKNDLRKEFKKIRTCIENKSKLDVCIVNTLFKSEFYKSSDLILCYVSFNDEIDTDAIITNSLKCNKKVAVPYCVDTDGNMEFYLINSLNDLKVGTFGIREPDINRCKIVRSFENALIIVPALSFDEKGYRLGYGKGYYDRFLDKYTLKSLGLCYNKLISKQLPIDKYDLPVDFVITESRVIACNNGGKNG